MIEILAAEISKNPVTTTEMFIISVTVKPYFLADIGLKLAMPTLIHSRVLVKPVGYSPVNQGTKLLVGAPAVEIVKIKN